MSNIDALTEAWAKVLERAARDAAFRKTVLMNAAEAFKQVGYTPTADIKVRVVESSTEVAQPGETLLVLPTAEAHNELSAGALDSVAGAAMMACHNPQTTRLTDCGNPATNWSTGKCSTRTTD